MKALISELELGFTPISVYVFNILINDAKFHEFVDDSHLYIIAQRRELTFNNFNLSDKAVKFEIRQEDNLESIECVLPIYQKNIASDMDKYLNIRFHDRRIKKGSKSSPPYNNTQAITFREIDKITGEIKHLIWLSPERLFYCLWNEEIEVNLNKDYRQMLEYKVHYVGKSTEQNICRRLSKHSTFQEILTNQDALTYGNIPSNEIVILLFKIKNNNSFTSWGENESREGLANFIKNYETKDDKVISLDAEKALIKHLQPEYNKILYKSYPTESDIINQDLHDFILYSFVDPITLVYNQGHIKGSEWMKDRDYIKVGKTN